MKQFLLGGVAGYLLTSIFMIPAPPSIFWWILGLSSAILSYGYFVWWKMDNDGLGEINE